MNAGAPSGGPPPAPGTCPLCSGPLTGTASWTVTDHLRTTDRILSFRQCARCASAALDPMPSAEDLLAAYPGNYCFAPREGSGLARLLKSTENSLFYRRMFRADARILRALGLPCGARLLDVGCGGGHRTACLGEMGFAVEGLDTHAESVALARETYGFPVHVGSLEEHAHALEGRYDVVTMYNVFEHLPDPASAVNAARKVLGEAGWLVLTSPLVDGLAVRLLGSRHLIFREAPRHVLIPSLRGLEDFLGRAGLPVGHCLPSSLLGRAGLVGLSLAMGGAYASAMRQGTLGYFLARIQAAATAVLAGIPVALAEYLRGPFSSVIVACRAEKGVNA